MSAPLPVHGRVWSAVDDSRPGASAPSELVVTSVPSKPSLLRAVAVATSRRVWGRRTRSWDERGALSLTAVVDAVLAISGQMPRGVAVDLGCGSGQVTLRLARGFGHVLGVDISSEAIDLLSQRATAEGLTNVQAVAQPVETMELPAGSVDLVVSNYALHHLRDVDKQRLLERAFVWLRPGGRLVIGDMMLGRGGDSADRTLILSKVRVLARRGPGGWWRIVKNSVRFALRVQEKPLPPGRWESLVREAGFGGVRLSRVVAEAWVISATKLPGTRKFAAAGAPRRGLELPR